MLTLIDQQLVNLFDELLKGAINFYVYTIGDK